MSISSKASTTPAGNAANEYEIVVKLPRQAAQLIAGFIKPYIYTNEFARVDDMAITLASWSGSRPQADIVARWLMKLLTEVQSFTGLLNNFSGQPPGTIYMRLMHAPQWLQLRNLLTQLSQYLMRYNGTAMVIPQKFYLTLASQLPAETYNSCISSLARLEQCVQVPVNYIEIIEYKTGNKSCQLVQRFQLPEGNTMTNQPWYLPLHAAPLATAV